MIEKCIGIRKRRQLYRLIRHCKVTFLCLILTIIVLRGTIGAGKFGTPKQDFLQLRNRFASRKLPLNALLDPTSFFGSDKPRVLLITGSKKGCVSLLKSVRNKVDYCRIHGLSVYYSEALLEAEMSEFRERIRLIRTVLVGYPEVEFVWWMDSDALFTDIAFEVPWERYKGYNVVVHGWKEMVFEEENWVGLNVGSFLVRNCRWSLDLLDSLGRMGFSGKVRVEGGEVLMKELKGRPGFEADDRVFLLAKEKEKWGDKVFLENEYYSHGFSDGFDDGYEKMLENYEAGIGDHRWPLVTHFVGCKLCAEVGDYSTERCLKLMERAFSLGEYQASVVSHSLLSSNRVRKVQDDMLNPHGVMVNG